MGDGNDEKDPSCMYEKLYGMDENDPAYNLEKSDKSASGLPNEDTQSQEGMEDTGYENIYEECQSSSSIYSSFRRLSPDYIEPISEKDHLWGLAVQEIIDTERSYVQQLHFCVHVLLPALSFAKVEGIDLDLLFGNIGDLLIVSKHLLEKLEAAECNDVGCSIGKIMLDLSVLMEEEYMGYCCNYDAAQAALEKYNEDPQMAKIIIQQESQLKHSLPHTGNLQSILIQPVQRIMRYPLLLDNLIAKMPPELLGYAELQAATSRFKDINVSINDTKRQQDLLVKYRKKHRESVSERLSHLNINTVRKMSSRFGVQFRQAAGFLTLTKDAVYEKSKSTFLELYKAIMDLLVHLPEYLQQLQCFSSQNPEVEWLALSDTACKIWAGWNQHLAVLYQHAICNIHQQHFNVLRNRLEELVQMPATDLLRAFKIPMFLIQKRNDKLLDVSGSDDGDEDIQHHRSYLEYQTLHSQLLDGLPKFCAHASSLYIAIFQGFLFAHTMFFESCIGELKLLQVVGHRNEEKTSSLSMEQELEDKLSHFDFGCNIGTVYPTISHPVMVKTKSLDTDCSVRRAERRELVFQAHEPSRLYVLRANTWVGNGVDLQLLCGDIVGFLKAHDGSGCSARWLVDCGGMRGLVLACLLTPYSKMRHNSLNDGASREGTSPRTPRVGFGKTTSDYYNMSSETCFNQMLDISKGSGESCNQESMTSTETRSLQACTASSDTTHFIAAYPFQADGPRQMDLIAGQHVHLKRSHDVSGNPEWWLVESNGSDGFVPRAYLVAANSPRHQQSPYPHQKQ